MRMATGGERLPAWQESGEQERRWTGQSRAQVLLRAQPKVTKRQRGFASKGQGWSAFRL